MFAFQFGQWNWPEGGKPLLKSAQPTPPAMLVIEHVSSKSKRIARKLICSHHEKPDRISACHITSEFATDFSSTIETLSISLSSSTTDAVWGSAVWGVALWGDVNDIFRQGKQQAQGRYLRIKWAEDAPQELFHIYGWSQVYWTGDVN